MPLRLLNWLDNAKQRWEKNCKQQRNNVYLSSFNFSHNGWLFSKCIWTGCKLFPGSSQPMNKTVTRVVISLMLSNTAFWFWQHVLKYNKRKTFTLQTNTVRKTWAFDMSFSLWSKFHKHIRQVFNSYLLNLTIAWSLIIWYLFNICDVSVVDLLIGLFVARSSAFARTDSIIGS